MCVDGALMSSLPPYTDSSSLGFFAQQSFSQNDQEIRSHQCSKLLFKDSRLIVRPFLQAVLDPVLTAPWQHVTTRFQNNDPTPFDKARGMAIREYQRRRPSITCHCFVEEIVQLWLVPSMLQNDIPCVVSNHVGSSFWNQVLTCRHGIVQTGSITGCKNGGTLNGLSLRRSLEHW